MDGVRERQSGEREDGERERVEKAAELAEIAGKPVYNDDDMTLDYGRKGLLTASIFLA